MYEVLILLVLANLGFTSYIWRTVRRGPKRKFLGKLLNGSPSRPIIHRLRYETAPSYESPTRIDGSSPISRCLPML
jgi:hypothetical protein